MSTVGVEDIGVGDGQPGSSAREWRSLAIDKRS
jgi:hypothetical protein